MDFFEQVSLASPDPIFGLQTAFLADKRPEKVNLSVGVYKTEELKTPVMRAVKQTEAHLLNQEKTKEYLPIEGDRDYLEKVGMLVFGSAFWSSSSARISSAQTVGGVGALRLGGDFVKQEKIGEAIYLSDPTWPNHKGVFLRTGLKVEHYPYYDTKKQSLDFDALVTFLKKLPPRAVVLLHTCCHNPTGKDLEEEQWKTLSTLFLERRLVPFFDTAYQGFGLGLEEDAFPLRLFAQEGHEMLVAISFSKNFSLYAERVGALFVISQSHKTAPNVLSRLKTIIRTTYSNPPLHGAKVVSTILGSAPLRKEWEDELLSMRKRIEEMRYALCEALKKKTKGKSFDFLRQRSGLFSFTGLSSTQVERMIKEFAIYMTSDGRINVCGLNWDNLDYVVDSLIDAAH